MSDDVPHTMREDFVTNSERDLGFVHRTRHPLTVNNLVAVSISCLAGYSMHLFQ